MVINIEFWNHFNRLESPVLWSYDYLDIYIKVLSFPFGRKSGGSWSTCHPSSVLHPSWSVADSSSFIPPTTSCVVRLEQTRTDLLYVDFSSSFETWQAASNPLLISCVEMNHFYWARQRLTCQAFNLKLSSIFGSMSPES